MSSGLRHAAGRLSLGAGLIAGAAFVLLDSDWSQRQASPSGIPRVAVMQFRSTVVLDDGVRGLLDRLRDGGYYQLGRGIGELAVRVLRGEDMSRMPILYATPRMFAGNRQALAGLRDRWRLPDDVVARAAKVL
jgi:ABC-type uncharacterized transport system substrate-binding protein